MNSIAKLGAAVLLSAVLSGCPEPTRHTADVKLTIDGKSFDYRTVHAQWDQQGDGGRYSIYLLPAKPSSGAPYVCMRTYVGNPVAQLWVRYDKPSRERASDAAMAKYQCFVPGTLADGRATIERKDDDGSERNRNETGDADCTASLVRKGDKLHLIFDASLPLSVKKKKGPAKGDREIEDNIRASGSAVLDLVPLR